jgi:hypothetical protein
MPQVIKLLQVLHLELSAMHSSMHPNKPMHRAHRMADTTEKILECVKNASVQAAGWGFSEDWDECIGLVPLENKIRSTWDNYKSGKTRYCSTPVDVCFQYGSQISRLFNIHIPRVQKVADGIEERMWAICAATHKRLGENSLLRCIDEHTLRDIVFASVPWVDI